jgi:hypothetical protein
VCVISVGPQPTRRQISDWRAEDVCAMPSVSLFGWPLGYGFFPSKIFSPKSISEEEIKKHPASRRWGAPGFSSFLFYISLAVLTT